MRKDKSTKKREVVHVAKKATSTALLRDLGLSRTAKARVDRVLKTVMEPK